MIWWEENWYQRGVMEAMNLRQKLNTSMNIEQNHYQPPEMYNGLLSKITK